VAKIFGIYPRKGALQIGSDADITIVDPKKTMTIRSENLYTKVAWTPYEAYEVKGIPVYTIVRGSVVMENSQVIGKAGYGEFVKPGLPVTSSS
jgi:dihydroorotase-like cyclic amidohydrolase